MSAPVRLELRTYERESKLKWREAGPSNHHNDKVDSDQWVSNKELSLPAPPFIETYFLPVSPPPYPPEGGREREFPKPQTSTPLVAANSRFTSGESPTPPPHPTLFTLIFFFFCASLVPTRNQGGACPY